MFLLQAIFKLNDSSDKCVGTGHSSHTLGRCLANILEPKCDRVTKNRSSEPQRAGKNCSEDALLVEGALLLFLAAALWVVSVGVMASSGDLT